MTAKEKEMKGGPKKMGRPTVGKDARAPRDKMIRPTDYKQK